MVLNKTMDQWCNEYPALQELIDLRETFWINTKQVPSAQAIASCSVTMEDIQEASDRLQRFAPYIASVFPETKEAGGLIESPIREIPKMKAVLEADNACNIHGNLLLKCDSHLPISGSIKARGGIYEVLALAERIAVEAGKLSLTDDYKILDSDEYRKFFSGYSIAVGSTGNLGLSIGIMAAKLGFKATVHMSADARQWKKDMLRSKGVEVIEYADDYSKAVDEGRKQAAADPYCHFVDDENSKTLFMGYAVSALRVKKQLAEMGVTVDEKHPLFVYLPCGVGGGPGGVAFGLKQVFGDSVHCIFAEPTHSPCMLLGIYTGYHDQVSVQDFGIDNKTAADGLAVGRASSFVGRIMEPFLTGLYTITDERMYQLLTKLADCEGIYLEPSALAGMQGPVHVTLDDTCKAYISRNNLAMSNAHHLVWATGGNMVPKEIMEQYYQTGAALIK